MKVLVIVVALLASAVASHLHSAHMQWQAKQQEEAQNYQPSDVPKLAQQEYYNMGDSGNQATDKKSNQEQEMETKGDDMASHNRHTAHNMKWRAVDQRERGKEQLENQALPSDVPKLAQQEYYNMGDSEIQDIMQSNGEQAREQFTNDEEKAVDVATQNRHAVPNMQWQAVDQWERGEEQLENQALPSDAPNLAQHEYFSMGARDSKNRDTMQNNDEQAMEQFANDEVDVASHNRHTAHNMQRQAVNQREREKEQLENQALPSDVPKLAKHEYYSMGDTENQDMMQSNDEWAIEQFANDEEIKAVDAGPSDEPSSDEQFAEIEALSLDAFGFQRVYLLDMTKSGQQCPKELKPKTYGTLRLCGKRLNGNGCSSIKIPIRGRQYSQVRGKVVAYQYASPDAFNTGTDDINRAYVDGISITYGRQNQRKHVWTLAVSVFPYSKHSASCPGTGYGYRQPTFVGDNYFCSSGNVDPKRWSHKFYDIPLWSRATGDCGVHCNKAKDVPFFCTKLPGTTTEDLEFRICSNQHLPDEDIQVQSIELYIK